MDTLKKTIKYLLSTILGFAILLLFIKIGPAVFIAAIIVPILYGALGQPKGKRGKYIDDALGTRPVKF